METSLVVVRRDGPKAPVQACLRYEATDPCAVRVLFHAGLGAGCAAVAWSFARDLLAAGLDQPAGLGDVRIWPWASPRGDFVALALSSPEGDALFEIPRCVLVRFLRRTYAVVPRGGEAAHLDVDGVLARLLADC